MREKLRMSVFRVIKWLIWVFYPKIEVVGAENLPDEPVAVVGNHTQMNGPIVCELYSPRERYTWCAAEMMHWKEVPAYAFEDFWSEKPKYLHWFYKMLAYIITPLAVIVFNSANTIQVRHDARVMTTFRESLKRLQEGADLVIFPECRKEYNHILYQFQDGFINLARMYYHKTGKELQFVPLYIAPKLKKMFYGKPIRFCASAPLEEERARICGYLMDEITRMADRLPEHTVVPYLNLPKRDYPKNKPCKEPLDEETRN